MSIQNAWNLLDEEVAQRHIPGAVALIEHDGKQFSYVTGNAVDTDEQRVPSTLDTIFDCASLTKVVVTLPLILMLVDQGKLSLDGKVSEVVPEFLAGEVTIRQLLTHTSGLPSSRNLHSSGWSRERILQEACSTPLSGVPGAQMVYSDLGFILLGVIIERVLNVGLDVAASQYVFEPLGMRDSGFCPQLSDGAAAIAATEFDAGTGRYLHGVVHDENARAMGGVSGHAGLFSTAGDLSRYAQMWLAGGVSGGQRILSAAIVEAAVAGWTPGLPEANRGLGWVRRGDRWDASGSELSDASYGHTGFTGTSLYVDPVNRLTIVLLTNRVHYGREWSITDLRIAFHDAVARKLVDKID